MSTDNWCTPKWLADLLGTWDLDPASNDATHVKSRVRCQLEPSTSDRVASNDGLAYDWSGRSVFCNPPYSDPLPWCRKLTAHDAPWCALLKLDPSTRWYAALMEASPVVAPFRKRLKFEGSVAMTANFPSVLIYSAWRPSTELASHLWLATYERKAS